MGYKSLRSTDNAVETGLHFLIAYPKYQIMTRFMYPNPKLTIQEKEAKRKIATKSNKREDKIMMEYEYSFKVKSLEPYIEYSEKMVTKKQKMLNNKEKSLKVPTKLLLG